MATIKTKLLKKNAIQDKINDKQHINVVSDVAARNSSTTLLAGNHDRISEILSETMDISFRKRYARQILINMILFSLSQKVNVATFGVTTAFGMYVWGK